MCVPPTSSHEGFNTRLIATTKKRHKRDTSLFVSSLTKKKTARSMAGKVPKKHLQRPFVSCLECFDGQEQFLTHVQLCNTVCDADHNMPGRYAKLLVDSFTASSSSRSCHLPAKPPHVQGNRGTPLRYSILLARAINPEAFEDCHVQLRRHPHSFQKQIGHLGTMSASPCASKEIVPDLILTQANDH